MLSSWWRTILSTEQYMSSRQRLLLSKEYESKFSCWRPFRSPWTPHTHVLDLLVRYDERTNRHCDNLECTQIEDIFSCLEFPRSSLRRHARYSNWGQLSLCWLCHIVRFSLPRLPSSQEPTNQKSTGEYCVEIIIIIIQCSSHRGRSRSMESCSTGWRGIRKERSETEIVYGVEKGP